MSKRDYSTFLLINSGTLQQPCFMRVPVMCVWRWPLFRRSYVYYQSPWTLNTLPLYWAAFKGCKGRKQNKYSPIRCIAGIEFIAAPHLEKVWWRRGEDTVRSTRVAKPESSIEVANNTQQMTRTNMHQSESTWFKLIHFASHAISTCARSCSHYV